MLTLAQAGGVAADDAIKLQQLHFGLNLLFAVLVIGHAGAALKHHFIDRDDILARMLPRRTQEKKS